MSDLLQYLASKGHDIGSCHKSTDSGIKQAKSADALWSLDETDISLYLTAIQAAQARKYLSEFVRHSWPVLEPGVNLAWNWHINAMADHIQWVLEGWLDRLHGKESTAPQNLLINVPPGTAKSRIVSVCATAWFWLIHPEWRALCLSANPKVALRDSMYARELIASDWYQNCFNPDWTMKESQDAKGKFENTRGGFRSAQGMTATITGDRADALFVDDPHDAADVYSEVKREAVHTKWSQAARNRVNDLKNTVRIGVMQRLHEDDWSGRRKDWTKLILPMEFDPSRKCITDLPFEDPRTEPGELLHPARFPREVVEEEKRELGSMGAAGQLQQLPAPETGGMFKRGWWRFFKWQGDKSEYQRPMGCYSGPARLLELSALDSIALSVDASFKETKKGSRVSILVIGIHKADRFILDNVTRAMDFPTTLDEIRKLVKKWKPSRVLIEDKANGSAAIQTLQSEISGVIAINPQGGKESRAYAVQPTVESGNVYLLQGAEWCDDFVHETGVFPNGTHDDQLDALSQALIYYQQTPAVRRARMLAEW